MISSFLRVPFFLILGLLWLNSASVVLAQKDDPKNEAPDKVQSKKKQNKNNKDMANNQGDRLERT